MHRTNIVMILEANNPDPPVAINGCVCLAEDSILPLSTYLRCRLFSFGSLDGGKLLDDGGYEIYTRGLCCAEPGNLTARLDSIIWKKKSIAHTTASKYRAVFDYSRLPMKCITSLASFVRANRYFGVPSDGVRAACK